MSYTLTFGKTKKHPCDTSRLMTDTRVEDVVLKDNVDIKAPIFTVNFDPSNYNYASWARSDGPTRYYWIDHCVHVHANYYDVYLSLDIMATYYDMIQHCLSGRLLYTTDDTYWDECFDDLRFSPSSLDVYDEFGWPDDAEAPWLVEKANVLGDEYADMWDVTYDVDGNIVSFGPGSYIVQVTSNLGPKTYVMSEVQFNQYLQDISSTFASGIGNLFSDPIKLTKLCNWVPFKTGILLAAIENYTLGPVYIGNDTLANAQAYTIPNWQRIRFEGAIIVPQNPAEAPVWMENSRWNKALLQTPTGTTELNLDMMYPRGQHDRIQFSTLLDIQSTSLDVKFTYDIKNHWSASGSQIYECNMDVGIDAMNLVVKYFNMAEGLVKAGLAGAAVAGAAFGGGMLLGAAGAGGGLAKMSAARAMQKSGLNLKQNGVSISKSMMQQGMAETMADMAPLAKVGAVGAAVSKLVPQVNTALSTIGQSTTEAALFNTTHLGEVNVRFKPLRCRELGRDLIGIEPVDKYKEYCDQFGYPANIFCENLYARGTTGNLYVFEEAHLDLTSYNGTDLQGITDEEMKAIEDIARAGFWYNVT